MHSVPGRFTPLNCLSALLFLFLLFFLFSFFFLFSSSSLLFWRAFARSLYTDLADAQRKRGILKRLLHHARAKVIQVATCTGVCVCLCVCVCVLLCFAQAWGLDVQAASCRLKGTDLVYALRGLAGDTRSPQARFTRNDRPRCDGRDEKEANADRRVKTSKSGIQKVLRCVCVSRVPSRKLPQSERA